MPDSISDSEYAMLMTSKRRGLPLMANGGSETLREGRNGVPLGRVAHHMACALKSLHELVVLAPEAQVPLLPAFRRMLHAYLGLYNMLAAARDRSLPERLLGGSRRQLETWLRAVALEGDVHGTASLDKPRPSQGRR
jgi:hypothetical protein